MTPRPAITFLAFGGTIASAPRPGSTELVAALRGQDLLDAVPGLASMAEIEVIDFPLIPSFAITTQKILDLASAIVACARGGADGVVISHGTDTIEETAYALALLIPREIPVVLTCAMRSLTAPGADGAANLLAAFAVAVAPEARELGPVVVAADEVHAARFVTKEHTTRLAAFGSPGAGPIGGLAESRVELWWRPAWSDWVGWPAAGRNPRVELLRLVLGGSVALLDALVTSPPDGLVIEGTGGGHVPPWLLDGLDALIAAGVPVVLASRVSAGANLQRTYRSPGSELDLIERGLLLAGDLRGIKARLRLWAALATRVPDLSTIFPVGSGPPAWPVPALSSLAPPDESAGHDNGGF